MQETREMRLHVEGVHGALHVGRGLFRRRFVVGGMSGTDTLPFVINMLQCKNDRASIAMCHYFSKTPGISGPSQPRRTCRAPHGTY